MIEIFAVARWLLSLADQWDNELKSQFAEEFASVLQVDNSNCQHLAYVDTISQRLIESFGDSQEKDVAREEMFNHIQDHLNTTIGSRATLSQWYDAEVNLEHDFFQFRRKFISDSIDDFFDRFRSSTD